MGRLQHLACVEGMEIWVVVAQFLRYLEQYRGDAAQRRRRGLEIGQLGETDVEMAQSFAQSVE